MATTMNPMVWDKMNQFIKACKQRDLEKMTELNKFSGGVFVKYQYFETAEGVFEPQIIEKKSILDNSITITGLKVSSTEKAGKKLRFKHIIEFAKARLSPLLYACNKDNIPIALYLIQQYNENKMIPEEKNETGDTPLHLACLHLNYEVILEFMNNQHSKVLLGATNTDGHLPIEVVQRHLGSETKCKIFHLIKDNMLEHRLDILSSFDYEKDTDLHGGSKKTRRRRPKKGKKTRRRRP